MMTPRQELHQIERQLKAITKAQAQRATLNQQLAKIKAERRDLKQRLHRAGKHFTALEDAVGLAAHLEGEILQALAATPAPKGQLASLTRRAAILRLKS